ncbi:MAG: PAS domain-containing sensor histidine kinase [Muribaculaceae bacterium]|nr:PAS domain-containing sensor histidine kinase [Muribaculaceae bacterium]
MTWFSKVWIVKNFKSYFLHCAVFFLIVFVFVYYVVGTENPIISKHSAFALLLMLLVAKLIFARMLLHKSTSSNTQLYDLINNSPMLSYVLNKDGEFLFGNAQAQRFLTTGIDVTLDGKYIEIPTDVLKSEDMNEVAKVLKTGECLSLEKPIRLKNGDYSWYSVHKTPLKNKNGKIYAVATFTRNIDAEKRIQEQRETYIATLSHDLKTPAIAQVRALELLLSGQMGEFNNSQKEMLKLTLDSCNYMYDMIYTLLSTCKFESGAVKLNYSTVDMTELLNESIHEISNLAQENSIKLELDCVEPCFIDVDKIEIKRVVINLLSNAINYAFPSTVVKVIMRTVDNRFEFRVINSSPYIEPEVMLGLFRKYVSHSQKYNKVGIGLGLYLSKKIVEAHDGEIIAESLKTQANTFGFIIPVYKDNRDGVEIAYTEPVVL